MRMLLTVVLFVNLYLIGITLGEVEFECPQLFTNLSGVSHSDNVFTVQVNAKFVYCNKYIIINSSIEMINIHIKCYSNNV